MSPCDTSPLIVSNYARNDTAEWFGSTYSRAFLVAREDPTHRAFSAALMAASLSITLVLVVLFAALKRRSSQHVRVRSTTVAVLLWVGLFIFNIVCVLPIVLPANLQMNCAFTAFVALLASPAITAAVLLRFIVFILSNQLAVSALAFARDQNHLEEQARLAEDEAMSASLLERVMWTTKACAYAFRVLFTRVKTESDDSTPEERVHTLRVLRFTTGRGKYAVFSLVQLPFVVIAAVVAAAGDPVYSAGCTGCSVSVVVFAFILVQGALTSGVGTVLFLKCYRLRDPWGLVTEAMWTTGWLSFALVGFLLVILAPQVTVTSGVDFSLIAVFGLVGAVVQVTLVPLAVGWYSERGRGNSSGSASSPMMRSPSGLNRKRPSPPARGQSRTLAATSSSDASIALASSSNNNNNNPSPSGTPNSQPRGLGAAAAAALASAAAAPSRMSMGRSAAAAASGAGQSGSQNPLPVVAPVHNGEIVDVHVAPTLHEILADPDLTTALEQTLVDEFNVENLLVLRDIAAWRLAYFDVSPTARLARARRIVRVYFSGAESLMQVNVSDSMVRRLRAQVMKAPTSGAASAPAMTDVPRDVFDEVRAEASRLLELGTVSRFRRSSVYLRNAAKMAVVRNVAGE